MVGSTDGAYADASLYRLTKGIGVGAHEVIACEDIVELAGLIKGGDKDEVYVVNKSGALWLDLGAEEVDAQHDDEDAASGDESEDGELDA